MDSLQEQILRLGEKVDALYKIIENLDYKLSQGSSECMVEQTQIINNHPENYPLENFDFTQQISFTSNFEHKDILIDGISPKINSQTGAKNITAETQIRRLTAQLTAAYNRIAALEDQLMQERIH